MIISMRNGDRFDSDTICINFVGLSQSLTLLGSMRKNAYIPSVALVG